MARVLLVHPGLNWCFKHMAEAVRKYASGSDFVLAMSQDEFKACVTNCGPSCFERLDAAFSFSLSFASVLRQVNALRYGTLVAHPGHCLPRHPGHCLPRHIPSDWRTNAVAKERNAGFAKDAVSNLDCVICLNSEIYRSVSEWNYNAVCIPQGLDLDVWKVRESEPQTKFTIGWCGDISGARSFKGHEEILMPLKEQIADADFVVNTQSYENAWPAYRMAMWYRHLHLFLCTAINEGGPYPPFEAAACGVPFLSTRVGIVADWPDAERLGCVVPTYHDQRTAQTTIRELRCKIADFIKSGDMRKATARKLCESARKHYSWEVLAPKWIDAMVGR